MTRGRAGGLRPHRNRKRTGKVSVTKQEKKRASSAGSERGRAASHDITARSTHSEPVLGEHRGFVFAATALGPRSPLPHRGSASPGVSLSSRPHAGHRHGKFNRRSSSRRYGLDSSAPWGPSVHVSTCTGWAASASVSAGQEGWRGDPRRPGTGDTRCVSCNETVTVAAELTTRPCDPRTGLTG